MVSAITVDLGYIRNVVSVARELNLFLHSLEMLQPS